MYLVDAVFLNAQMDRNEASLSVELRQAACRRISNFLPDLVRNLTTPSNCEQVRSQIPSLVLLLLRMVILNPYMLYTDRPGTSRANLT